MLHFHIPGPINCVPICLNLQNRNLNQKPCYEIKETQTFCDLVPTLVDASIFPSCTCLKKGVTLKFFIFIDLVWCILLRLGMHSHARLLQWESNKEFYCRDLSLVCLLPLYCLSPLFLVSLSCICFWKVLQLKTTYHTPEARSTNHRPQFTASLCSPLHDAAFVQPHSLCTSSPQPSPTSRFSQPRCFALLAVNSKTVWTDFLSVSALLLGSEPHLISNVTETTNCLTLWCCFNCSWVRFVLPSRSSSHLRTRRPVSLLFLFFCLVTPR